MMDGPKLFIKDNGCRKEYLYGPSWKAMELLLEGGYSTPEEAKAQWEHERAGRGEDVPGRTGGTALEGN